MGKLIQKLVRSIMPSWLFTRFKCTNPSSKKLLHLRLKQGIHFTSSKSSAPVLPPSSSAPSNTEPVDLLIAMDQSVYYYSQSEDEPEQAITGNSNHIPSPSIESKCHDDDDDDQIHATKNPRMGICALGAASIIKGTWHDDKFEPTSPHKEIECPTSPASLNLQSHHDNDIHLQNHQQEECLDNPHPIQHQIRKLTTSSKETGFKKGDHHNGHGGHSCQHQHQHQALPDENPRQHHVADGPAHAHQHCKHHANNESHTNQRSQHHAGDAAFCQNDDPRAHHYHDDDHYMYHHAGDGISCQHDDDDVCRYVHHNHHNNHMYKYNHDAGNGSLYMPDDDVYHYAHQYNHKKHGYKYHHHGQGYGSNNLLCMSKEGRTKPNIKSLPLSSFAKSAKTETQHDNDHQHQHHNQFQNDNPYYQHNASNIDYHHRTHLGGLKRKSICLNGIDEKEDVKDEDNHHLSISARPCVKRQRTHEGDDVACELPECITEKVGNSCAIVQYSYQYPQFAYWKSMMQMIVSNDLWDSSELQFLLQCYLALNDPHLHHIIHTSFVQVLKDLQQSVYDLG